MQEGASCPQELRAWAAGPLGKCPPETTPPQAADGMCARRPAAGLQRLEEEAVGHTVARSIPGRWDLFFSGK